jgi:MOSC domain-containing protein YiiM
MQIASINIGKEQTLVRPGKTEQTGIFKQPETGPVTITYQGLPGDFIGDKKHHGGPDQAVYIYGSEDYAWWAAELGRDLAPGTFGENLTISGLACADFAVGDILHFGGVTLQVTAPRIPCGTLAGRMGDPQFVKRFRASERPGLYCRVLREGQAQAGDEVVVERYHGERISIPEIMRDHYEPELTETALRRYLAAPIAIRLRAKKQEQLQTLLGEGPAGQ